MDFIYNTFVVIYFFIAAIMDLKWRRVKNWLILLGLIFGSIFNLILTKDLIQSIYGFLLPISLLFFYRLKMIGAGDIKLLSVAGYLLGFDGLINCLLKITVFAVILVIIAFLKKSIISKSFPNSIEPLPLAVAISLGITVGILGG